MAWIFVDKEEESGGDKMRKQMRRNMRGGDYRYPMMRHGGEGEYDHGYRMGYKHGWEDRERDTMMDDDDVEYRRRRDSRGRYM